jgi:hypothetical protein
MNASANSPRDPAEHGQTPHLVAPVCDRCGAILGTRPVAYDEIVVCEADESCWLSVQFQTVLAFDGRHSTGLTTETLPSHIGPPATRHR